MFLLSPGLFLAAIFSIAHSCQLKGDVKSTPFTTTDGLVITDLAHIVTFTVQCADATKSDKLTLFADIGDGNLLPVVKARDGSKYQVSWTRDLAKSGSASYEIKVYDRDGFNAIKRGTVDVKPLLNLNLYHPGTYKGPWLQTELLATLGFTAVWYLAYRCKSNISS